MNDPWYSNLNSMPAALTNPGAQPLLSTPADITPVWLQRVGCLHDLKLPHVASLQCDVLQSTDSSTLCRLLLGDGKGDHLPARVLVKISRPAFYCSGAAAAEREVAALQELNRHHACRVPAVYFALNDGERSNLLLTDVPGRVHDRLITEACDLSLLRAVLAELAVLHGCFAGVSPAGAPAWLLRLRDSADHSARRYKMGVGHLLQSGTLSEAVLALLCELLPWVSAWHRYERHRMTFTHGHAGMSNTLLAQTGERWSASLINWQTSGLRNPMVDIANLFAGTLSVALRRRWESHLLEEYRSLFEQSGCQYNLAELQRDYRYSLCAPLIEAVCSAADYPGVQHTGLLNRLERCAQALLDWRSLELLTERLRAEPPQRY